MKPLFEVGEQVFLQSVNKPELNGECIVLEVYTAEGWRDVLEQRYPHISWVEGELGYSYVLLCMCNVVGMIVCIWLNVNS